MIFHCGEGVRWTRRRAGSHLGTVSGSCSFGPPDRRDPRSLISGFPKVVGVAYLLEVVGFSLHPHSQGWPWPGLEPSVSGVHTCLYRHSKNQYLKETVKLMKMYLQSSSWVEGLFEELNHTGAWSALESIPSIVFFGLYQRRLESLTKVRTASLSVECGNHHCTAGSGPAPGCVGHAGAQWPAPRRAPGLV